MKNTERSNKVVVLGDIRGFTAFMENESESLSIRVLKDFYETVEKDVQKYGGFKVEFIADEFLTFFDDPYVAVNFCISVRDHLNKFLKKYQLGIGFGVSYGTVLGGLWG
ncbi:MAG TPA: adenylate/guanylate cyclase domain-containing protein [Candidatus Dojkabacteria bacterium]|nr:adenylate/guanylate cyclase domain-containing protein [Candidatus Dojkabacteria bacterium]HQF37084.1 adenylate/guanylate cyclase domain-containing protein [Candidatus Dojkabacteria bacterium]